MLTLQKSEATAAQRRVPLHLVDATDGITPETGESGGQPQLSKNGAAFGNTTATLTAVANGLYYVELTQAELDTVGFGAVRFKSANTAEFQIAFQVVEYDPYSAADLGLTNLDATISSRATPAQVNTEVLDVVNVDTVSEESAGAPTATPTMRQQLNYLYMAWRNKITTTSSQHRVFQDDGTTVLCRAPVSDDSTTFTQDEFVAN